MATVITAKRSDTCCDPQCPDPEIPAGARINYGGPGAITHQACQAMDAPRRARAGRRDSKYAYTNSGARVTMSSRRCEDAPCCGCCD
jgi:hypothetical protein